MRTKKILMSSLAETIPYIILGIIGFVKVRILIDYLGSDLNGYYQFTNQIISYLFLIEAGFGRAVIYTLYKPFADGDHHNISAIFKGARKIFRGIGFAILGLITTAMFIVPFVFHIKGAYLLPVMGSFFIISLSYLIAYFGKSNAYYALFCADQKKYVYSLVFNGLKIVDDILIIFVAIYFHSLIGVALVILFIKIIEEMMIRYFGKKHFPFLVKKVKADTSSFKMTKDLIWHQVSFLVSNNVDMVVLMYFLNPFVVSVYATYNFIARFLNEFTTRINNVVSYSFGNMFAKGEEEKRGYQLNDEYFILSAFLAMAMGLTFIFSIRPFVGLWIGNVSYYVSYTAVILFGLNLFFWTIYSPLIAIINAKGLYKESKYIVIFCAVINVALSFIFVSLQQHNGMDHAIIAVLSATVISNIFNIILRSIIVHKYVFKKTRAITTIIEYSVYSIMFVLIAIGFKGLETYLFANNQNIVIIISLIGLITVGISTAIFIILYLTKHNTKLLVSRVLSLIKRKRVV